MNTAGWVTLIGAITALVGAAGGLAIAILKLRNSNAKLAAIARNSPQNPPDKGRYSSGHYQP